MATRKPRSKGEPRWRLSLRPLGGSGLEQGIALHAEIGFVSQRMYLTRRDWRRAMTMLRLLLRATGHKKARKRAR